MCIDLLCMDLMCIEIVCIDFPECTWWTGGVPPQQRGRAWRQDSTQAPAPKNDLLQLSGENMMGGK